MSNKEKVLEYCSTIKTHDIEHLDRCLNNEICIKEEKYSELEGCPCNYGLNGYIGLCEIDGNDEDCVRCWKTALDI